MSLFYSNPQREDDPYALPDCEVFWHDGKRYDDGDCWADDDGEPLPEGFYYWFCFPGCMPDSDPYGPFNTEEEAIEDCRERYSDV